MTKLSKQPNDCNGFSLIETVVAIAILLVVVSGIMNVIYQGATSSQLQQERITANYLAADAIEFIRADRDTYWLDAIGSNTFDGWLETAEIDVCREADGCRVDTRLDEGNIADCTGECPLLKRNRNTNQYGYTGGGLAWNESNYRRTVEIEAINHDGDSAYDEAIVTVTVEWERSGGGISSVTLEESLLGWWR